MSAEINYKNKYIELRSKYMNDLDMAFRLGMEQGMQQAQNDQAAQAQAEQQQLDQMAAGGAPGQPGQPGQEGNAPGQPQPGQEQLGQPGQEAQPGQDPMAGQPTELDQHISKLEGMIAKSEDQELKNTLQGLVSLRKSELQKIQFSKSEQAIKGIVKALHKPTFKMGAVAVNNLSTSAKLAASAQHKIVNEVMEKFEVEEKRASAGIKDILNLEGLTSKG